MGTRCHKWPESKVASRHRGHVIVSLLLGKSERPLIAARLTTAVIGALIATVPECCGVVWAGRVARPADVWLEESRWSLAPYAAGFRYLERALTFALYAAAVDPNQRTNASSSPCWLPSPIQATWPSGRTSTAPGAATCPTAGSSHWPS